MSGQQDELSSRTVQRSLLLGVTLIRALTDAPAPSFLVHFSIMPDRSVSALTSETMTQRLLRFLQCHDAMVEPLQEVEKGADARFGGHRFAHRRNYTAVRASAWCH